MSSTKETVYMGDNSKEIFISGIDENGVIVYHTTLNDAEKDEDTKNQTDNSALTFGGSSIETIEESDVDSLDDPYYPFKDNRNVDQAFSLQENSVNSHIGPFSDNRPICECDIIKQLCASTDVRYLLSLLPDMAEMNPKQKIAFKNRIFQLINRILNGDSIDLEM